MPNQQNPTDYRPPRTGNAIEDLFKKNVLDFVYELRSQVGSLETEVSSLSNFRALTQATGQTPNQNFQAPLAANSYNGTHAVRLGYSPSAYAGAFFFETDRNAFYFSNGTAWVLIEMLSFGTFEARWGDLGANDTGAIYFESSRNSVSSVVPYPMFRWNNTAWVALDGLFARNQNAVATLGATLGANDTGVQVDVLDYAHNLSWNGTAFNYADPTDPPGRIEGFLVDPVGNGWVLCNGTNSTYLLGNGTTANVTLPDMTSNASRAAFLLFGTPANAALNAPVAPTFTGDPMAAHLHDAPVGDSGNFLTTYTLSVQGTGNNYTAISKVVSTADNTTGIAAQRTSLQSGGTPSGNVSANATPQSITLRPWFRR